MFVGYMRVSSDSDRQTTNLQRDALMAAGVDSRHLFEDHASGAKDDRRDALVLADALRTDRQAYRLLEPMHPTIIELREWSRMTEDLSAERNRLANRFRHQLWRYFPQVIDLAEDWASLWILDLWDLIPTPARARTTSL